jgi:hypothetical protein
MLHIYIYIYTHTHTHIYIYEDSILKTTNFVEKEGEEEWKYNGGDELIQATLHMHRIITKKCLHIFNV